MDKHRVRLFARETDSEALKVLKNITSKRRRRAREKRSISQMALINKSKTSK